MPFPYTYEECPCLIKAVPENENGKFGRNMAVNYFFSWTTTPVSARVPIS